MADRDNKPQSLDDLLSEEVDMEAELAAEEAALLAEIEGLKTERDDYKDR